MVRTCVMLVLRSFLLDRSSPTWPVFLQRFEHGNHMVVLPRMPPG